MRRSWLPLWLVAAALAAPAAAYDSHVDAAAIEADLRWLADDVLEGRGSGAAGGLAARELLIDELETIGPGLNTGALGRDAYLQEFEDVRANLFAVIPGVDADTVVMVGAHYDHLDPERCNEIGDDDVCNGAVDNASGVAAVLAIGRALGASPTPPARTIVLALWDGEELGLRGSKWFTDHPHVPLAEIVGYVNFDMQGASLAPSVREFSFAIGAESGGELMTAIVGDAITQVGLDTRLLTITFGQGRSDYHPIQAEEIPIVFFTDATNACYHTPDDEVAIVDFAKLAKQTEIAYRVVTALSESVERPPYVPLQALDTYDDLVSISALLTTGLPDAQYLDAEDQQTFHDVEEHARALVDAGPEAFQPTDALLVAQDALDLVARFPCDPALLPEPGAAPFAAVVALAIAARRRLR
jgi:hypothetical protein